MWSLAADVTLSTGTLVALIILGVIEIGLLVFCLVDIVRRPVVLGGHKWLWIVVVVLFGIVGGIVYLAVARTQPPAPEPNGLPDADARTRTQAAADLLYGQQSAPPSSPPGDQS